MEIRKNFKKMIGAVAGAIGFGKQEQEAAQSAGFRLDPKGFQTHGPGFRKQAKRRRGGKWVTRTRKHRRYLRPLISSTTVSKEQQAVYMETCAQRVYRWFKHHDVREIPERGIPGCIQEKMNVIRAASSQEHLQNLINNALKTGSHRYAPQDR